jgi:hypothetical protein
MEKRLLLIIGIALVLSIVPALFLLLRSYLKFRGQRVVTCPETRAPVAVELDAAHAAAAAMVGDPDFRLQSCSRWPEREDCGQQCLAQIESAPDGCLIKSRLARWYENSTCAVCGGWISEIHWYDRKPGAMTLDRKFVEWQDIATEDLPRILATHERVCSNCADAESFRARFPNLVVDDPWHPGYRPDQPRRGPDA